VKYPRPTPASREQESDEVKYPRPTPIVARRMFVFSGEVFVSRGLECF
jgi:hypothetical protein